MGLLADIYETLGEHEIVFGNKLTAQEFINAFKLENVRVVEQDNKYYVREVKDDEEH